MSQEEIVISNSDDVNLGLMITSVQSLADNVKQGTRSSDLSEQSNSVIVRISGQRATPVQRKRNKKGTLVKSRVKRKRHKKETFVKSRVCLPQSGPEQPVSMVYVSPDLEASLLLSTSNKSCASTPVQSKKGKGQDVELVQKVQSCIEGWKSVFSWLVFIKASFQFTCSICQWGYDLSKYHNVYSLQNKNNLHSVAGKLRSHSKKRYHENAEKEQQFIISLCKIIYSIIKLEIFGVKDLECFKNKIPDLVNYGLTEAESIINIILHNLAVYIEESYLYSLRKSPYFSVMVMSEHVVIVRWIDVNNKVVEHLFFDAVQKKIKKLPMLAYLKYKGIDMTRMVSHSTFTIPSKELAGLNVNIRNVAYRCCPMDSLLKWLKHAEALQDLFKHLEAFAWMYSKSDKCDDLGEFCGFTKGSIVDAYKCIKKDGALYSIFLNHIFLDEILRDFSELRDINELDFKKLCYKKQNPIIKIIFSLAKLNILVGKYKSVNFLEELECYKRTVTSAGSELTSFHRQMDNSASADSEKDFFVLALIDSYIDSLSQAKTTQSQGEISFFDALFKDMKDVSFDDLEGVFFMFMEGLSGGRGFYQLQELNMLFGRDRNNSPMKLLSNLQDNPEFATRYPELLKFGQMLMVIPMHNAHVERNFFDVIAAERFFKGKVNDSVLQLLVYVYLERRNGLGKLDMEKILQYYVSS